MRNKLSIIIALCVLAAAVAAITIPARKAQAPVPQLQSDLYPLYSGIAWQSPALQTLQLGQTTYRGVGIVSASVDNVTDLGEVFAPFQAYYQDKLLNLGWTEDQSLQANGPGSGLSVFRKGSDIVVTQYQSIFTQGGTSSPEQCPCDITLSLFSSEQ